MNWINLTDAENKLKNSEFSDAEALKYLIASVIMYTLISFGVVDGNLLGFVGVTLQILISIWGINKVFNENGAEKGIDFFKRYIVLSWIIGFRMFLISLFVIIPSIIIIKVFFDSIFVLGDFKPEDVFNLLFGIIFSILYYLYFSKSIKRLN